MPEMQKEMLRKLADWSANGAPVSSLYLDVDGKRYPRKVDVVTRGEQLFRRLKADAQGLARDAHHSVVRDTERMREYLEGLERGPVRGVVLFSCSSAGLWEEVTIPRPVADRAALGPNPYLVPLEAVFETFESFCTVLVDREKARIFLSRMGGIQERADVLDDVPGQHDQGGWSQARYSRHIEEHVARHLKHVADLLLRFHQRRPFDHLILAGPDEIVAEFERNLHDYLGRRIAARLALPMTSSAEQVLESSLAVEEQIEIEREQAVRDRLAAESAAGRRAVVGFAPVLDALHEGRVETLVAPLRVAVEGSECEACGLLATTTVAGGGSSTCPACGGTMHDVPDVVDRAVGVALRQGSTVETLPLTSWADGDAEIGAILRF